jgi:hypothetical protein
VEQRTLRTTPQANNRGSPNAEVAILDDRGRPASHRQPRSHPIGSRAVPQERRRPRIGHHPQPMIRTWTVYVVPYVGGRGAPCRKGADPSLSMNNGNLRRYDRNTCTIVL